MSWSFDNTKPIYLQIMEKIKLQIVSHELEPNQQLPTVRDLASEAGVNPNTIQRALSDLEREGFVYSKRTTGRFVTEDLSPRIWTSSFSPANNFPRSSYNNSSLACFNLATKKEELPNVLSDYIKGV